MLTRLTVRNFKSLRSAEIELGSPVVFVGPSDSVKTSALQALALWDLRRRRWTEKRGGPTPAERPGVAVNRRDLAAVPTPSARQLCWDLLVRRNHRGAGGQRTENIRIDVIVQGITGPTEWTCGLEFDFANAESFHCRPLRTTPDGSERMPVPDAHLEILRQRQTFELLSEAAAGNGTQVIAASHSEVVLNEAAERGAVVAFVGSPHRLDRPFVHCVGNQPTRARRHYHGLREAEPDLAGFALFDHLDRGELRSEGGLAERMRPRREIENCLRPIRSLTRYARRRGAHRLGGPLFEQIESDRWSEAMDDALRDRVPPRLIATSRTPTGTRRRSATNCSPPSSKPSSTISDCPTTCLSRATTGWSGFLNRRRPTPTLSRSSTRSRRSTAEPGRPGSRCLARCRATSSPRLRDTGPTPA